MNKGNAIFNDRPIAIKDRLVHIMAVINLNLIAYLTLIKTALMRVIKHLPD